MLKKLFVVAAVTLASLAQAQTPAKAQTPAPSSAAKKELVAKVLQLQQPALELAAQALTERPAAQIMQQASLILKSRVAPEQREAVGKEIQADVKKYLDEAVPLVRARAIKLAPTTIGVLLDERFSEEELKQLIAIIESPVNRKFSQLGGEMEKVLGDKLVAETQGAIEPKVKTLQQSVAKRLGLPAPAPAAAAAPARPPAKAASK